MNEPHLWWYVTRASAVVAWVLLTVSVVLGILLSTRVMRKIDNPAWLQDLHRFVSGLAVVMVVLHMASLMLDSFAHLSVAEILVPGATQGSDVVSMQQKTIPIALGILAFYLLIAVQGTSWFMNRLPRKLWKGIHYASYGALILVMFHAGFTGTDVSELWYKSLSIVLIAAAAGAVIVRATVGARTRPARGATPRADEARVAPVAPPVPKRRMRVTHVSTLATGVKGIRLVPVDGDPVDIWHPGAHVTLYLPDGRERQYSLCGDPAERDHVDIAVLKRPGGDGGSEWIHRSLKVGSEIDMSPPRNHFDLEPATRYVFVAGGIGITPIKAMIESLPLRREWDLFYFGRSRQSMAFVSELEEEFPQRVHVIARDEVDEKADLAPLVTRPGALVYACGPESLMSAVAELVPSERMHLERFQAVDRSGGPAQPVDLHLRKSGKTIHVPADESLLDAMVREGVPLLGSCKKGLCGTCEVRVRAGRVDHRDSIMTDEEKDELHVMYPCVSRAFTPDLTLDA